MGSWWLVNRSERMPLTSAFIVWPRETEGVKCLDVAKPRARFDGERFAQQLTVPRAFAC